MDMPLNGYVVLAFSNETALVHRSEKDNGWITRNIDTR